MDLRPDRLDAVKVRSQTGLLRDGHWSAVLAEIVERLRAAGPGRVALIASARQTNEELYLLSRLARGCGALTDSVPRPIQPDHLLVCSGQNPNSAGARLMGLAADPMGSNLAKIADAIRAGTIRALVVSTADRRSSSVVSMRAVRGAC